MKGNFLKNRMTALFRDEKGVALVLVLVFLMLGAITIVPVLAHISTALESGREYEVNSNQLYTADSGIEESLWRIKYDFMGVDYDAYDFFNSWPYETELLNGETATFTVKNVWFPSNETAPSPAEAQAIIESEKLVVVGSAGAIVGEPYNVKVDFTPDPGDNLMIKSLGVWLPQGFEYEGEADSCNLYSGGPFTDYYPDDTDVAVVPGGSSVVWSYNPPYPLFTDFPGVDPGSPTMSLTFTFKYTPPPEDPDQLPVAIAWTTTDMTVGEFGFTNPNDVPISWDTDTRFFEVLSTSGDTSIQAFTSKCELRQMGDAMSGDYIAIGGSLLSDDNYDNYRETWHTPSSFNLSTIPEDSDVVAAYLYWAGWRNSDAVLTLLDDSCSNFDNWSYYNPSAWYQDSDEFKGHYNGDGDDSRLLTLDTQDLSPQAPGSVTITWKQGTEIEAGYSEGCEDLGDWNNGGAWNVVGYTDKYYLGHSTQPDTSSTRWLTLKNAIDLDGCEPGTVYVFWNMWENDYLDGSDGLDYSFFDGIDWSDWEPAFRGNLSGEVQFSEPIPEAYLTSEFKIRFRLIGFDGYAHFSKELYMDDIAITGDGFSASDGLDFAFSGNGGLSWSDYTEAFRGELSTLSEFSVTVPAEYTTGEFAFRFNLIGCDGFGETLRLDDFKITCLDIDKEITFKIDGEQVYFDGSNPASGPNSLTAGRSYFMFNYLGATEYGFSYACARDVTALLKAFTDEGDPGHYPGNAVYTVDGISSDTLLDDGWTKSHFAHAGWSLIVVYASPETAGHYIYIRDDNYAFNSGINENLDFDEDGTPGGEITNFVVPEPIKDQYGAVIETVAAKLTCFVVEGDDWLNNDSVSITGQQSGLTKVLSNSQSPANDAWNGRSYPGTYDEGVDIDTYEVLWTDNILTPDDNVLYVDLYSNGDAWNLVYFIISVRSETVTGGTSHYVIYG